MPTTYPLSTLAAAITSTGITAPSYADIYASFQASFKSIYGSDAYIAPDSQDGQLLALVAKAIFDANNATIGAYNAYSPATAVGAALDSAVRLNGIARSLASNSTALLTLVGQVGTTINSGVVADSNGNKWNLPATVVIPLGGTIDATATCSVVGSVSASANTINQIQTPTLGWQSATNAAAATPGQPVESDAALRQRQAISTALPSKTVLIGVAGAVAACTGVTGVTAYENDSNLTDGNGLPPHSIALVVKGGVSTEIARAIYLKKTPGVYTHGSTAVVITDDFGITNTIRYFVPTAVPIKVGITIQALTGYTSAIGAQIIAAVVAHINTLGIGKTVYISKLYLPVQLYGAVGSETFKPTVIQISISPAALGNLDIPIGFSEAASCVPADVVLTVV